MKLLRYIGRILALFGYILFLMLVLLAALKLSAGDNTSTIIKDYKLILILVLAIVSMIGGKVIEAIAIKKIKAKNNIFIIEKTKEKKVVNILLLPGIIYLLYMMMMSVYKMSGICLIYCKESIISKIVIFGLLIISLLLIFLQVNSREEKNILKNNLKLVGLLIFLVSIFTLGIGVQFNIYILVSIIYSLLLVILGFYKKKNIK